MLPPTRSAIFPSAAASSVLLLQAGTDRKKTKQRKELNESMRSERILSSMASAAIMESAGELGGFSFGAPLHVRLSLYYFLWSHEVFSHADNVRRNAALAALGMKAPTATKTGTTIAGIVYKVQKHCKPPCSIFASFLF